MDTVTVCPEYEVGQLVELQPIYKGGEPGYDRIKSIRCDIIWNANKNPLVSWHYFLAYAGAVRAPEEILRVVEEKKK